jgi:hypothetical protein
MPRGRKRAARRRTGARRRPPVTRASVSRAASTRPRPAATRRGEAPRPSEAETRLLALARDVAGLGADALPRAIRALASACAPDGALPRVVQQAWLATRGDKTAALALAWAREQVRLGLQEVIEATPPSRRGALGLPADTLAWLLLAACESLAHEPPSAAADRLRVLLDLTSRPSADRGAC